MTSKKYPLHEYCAIFPPATESIIADMADDILIKGQTHPIVLYENQVLDGQNRQLACEKAGVEPSYVHYQGDAPLGFVVSNNLHRRHLNDSQRAYLSQEVYKIGKRNNLELTAGQIAEQFNVTERALQRAGRVAEVSSETIQKMITSGELSVRRAEDALQEAQLQTGIKVTKATTEAERKLVQKAQERILENLPVDGEVEMPEEFPVKNRDAQIFNEMVLSGVFDRRRWSKNVRDIQNTLDQMDRLPPLFNDSVELVETLQQEMNFNQLISLTIEAIDEARGKFRGVDKDGLHNNLKTLDARIREICKLDLSDFEKCNERVLFDSLRKRYDEKCAKIVTDLEALRKAIFEKATM